MRRGPEDLLPNSHQDWADVYKFDKFMAKNWVSKQFSGNRDHDGVMLVTTF